MTLPDQDLQAVQASASDPKATPQEHDLRFQGLLAVLASAAGTCAAFAAWMRYGILQCAAILVATFMLLVIVLMTGSARSARKVTAAQGDTQELKPER